MVSSENHSGAECVEKVMILFDTNVPAY